LAKKVNTRRTAARAKFGKVELTEPLVPLKPKNTATRWRVDLPRIWRCAFDWERKGEKRKWQTNLPADLLSIGVPGSWNEQFQEARMRDWMGPVWFYQDFVLPAVADDHRVLLYFGAANYRARVWVNGQEIGGHEGGYMPFEFDITDVMAPAGQKNLVAVRVDNELTHTTVPQGGVPGGLPMVWRPNNVPNVHYDFFPHGGLHRPVALHIVPDESILEVRCYPSLGRNGSATVQFDVTATSGTKVRVRMVDAAGKVAGETTASPDEGIAVEIAKVKPWSCEKPHLYEVQVELLDENDELLDQYVLETGVREVQIKKDGLYLNGKKVFLKGCGRHEESPIAGKGLSEPWTVKDVELLKWLNANSFRTSHYPYSEEALELADREGLLVIDEAPANTMVVDVADRQTQLLHGRMIEELVYRDFNHPSVIAWSLANESRTHTKEGAAYFRPLIELTKQVDPTRPVTVVLAGCMRIGDEELVAPHCDFIAFNYYPAWYTKSGHLDAVEERLPARLKEYHKMFGKPVLLSEFGADAVAGLHRWPAEMWSEEYQVEVMRRAHECLKDLPWLMGIHPWVLADFKCPQDVSRVVFNHKGLFTRDRQPKMAAHVVREIWKNYRKNG
jgi:beta-glucuronidase